MIGTGAAEDQSVGAPRQHNTVEISEFSAKKDEILAYSHLHQKTELPKEASDRGPFVYRLGRQVFNLERGVRFP